MEVEQSGRFLRRIAWLAVAITTAAIITAAAGIAGLRFNSHYSAYFDETDSRLIAHQAIARSFSRHDSVVVVLHSPDSTVLEPDTHGLIESITAAMGKLPHAVAAFSFADLDIIGENELDDGRVLPTGDQLAAHDRAIGLLVSEDLRFAAIRVEFLLPGGHAASVLETMAAVRALVDRQAAGSGLVAFFTGTLALNEAYIEVVRHDLKTIVPVLLVTMWLILSWLLGSVKASATLLPVGLVSVAAAFGLAGLLSAELAAINSFVPVIIFSISLAGCVHMSISYAQYRGHGLAPGAAARQAVRFNLLPMAMANGTTALGFLGLLLSPSPPVRVVGYIVACGVCMSFLLCMTLLPALQAWIDPRPRPAGQRTFGIARIAGAVANNRRTIFLLFALLGLPASWLATKNVISDNVFEYFPESHAYYQDTMIVEQQFSGVNEVLYELDFGYENALFSADNIESLAAFVQWLRAQPEVLRVTSLTDHAAIVEARSADRLQERLSRYQRLVATGDQPTPLAAREVSADYASVLTSVYLRRMDSAELVAFDRRVREWLSDNARISAALAGGPSLMFAYLGESNIRSMLVALSIALIVAALLLGIVLRSPRVAVGGLICNILPIVLVYSAWAILNGRISIGAAVVMGMILGIVIDDTIYLSAIYRRRVLAGDENPVAAALSRVGPALIVTTITLVAGLGMGLFSVFGPIWSMSVLSVAVIAAALITDLSLLPAILMDRRGK